jgi:hypothetical protein
MTNFNRRRFMSLAGVAGVAPATSTLVGAETKTSGSPVVLTRNGEWTYQVVSGWDRSPRARALEARMAPLSGTVRATFTSARKVRPECSSTTAMAG